MNYTSTLQNWITSGKRDKSRRKYGRERERSEWNCQGDRNKKKSRSQYPDQKLRKCAFSKAAASKISDSWRISCRNLACRRLDTASKSGSKTYRQGKLTPSEAGTFRRRSHTLGGIFNWIQGTSPRCGGIGLPFNFLMFIMRIHVVLP